MYDAPLFYHYLIMYLLPTIPVDSVLGFWISDGITHALLVFGTGRVAKLFEYECGNVTFEAVSEQANLVSASSSSSELKHMAARA